MRSTPRPPTRHDLNELEAFVAVARHRSFRKASEERNVTASRPAARLLLAPLLAGFLKAHPSVTIEVVTDDQLVDIVARGYDAGVRFGESLALDMVAVPIGAALRFAVVASPGYLAAHGRPAGPLDLRGLPCIGRRFPSGVIYSWEFERDGEKLAVGVDGPLMLDDDEMMVDAARDGVGIAFVHEHYAMEHIRRGTVVRLLDEWCPATPGFHLYYPSRKHMSAALRGFVDWCVKHRQA